jgi:nucleotide-binding universal stress UspA family protein
MEYDGAEPSPVVVAEWSERLGVELAAAVAGWRTAYPDLEVELRVVHDQAAHALVVASGEVDELVLVRRAHGFPTGVHLGSTARTVLRASACPVRVLPPGHTTVVPPPALVDVTS